MKFLLYDKLLYEFSHTPIFATFNHHLADVFSVDMLVRYTSSAPGE